MADSRKKGRKDEKKRTPGPLKSRRDLAVGHGLQQPCGMPVPCPGGPACEQAHTAEHTPRVCCVAQNVRVVQRNLVYVVGLAMDICHEDVLKGADYFGQFGKVYKVLLHPRLRDRQLSCCPCN